jgi:dTDP-glucose 4,6-dehydratase
MNFINFAPTDVIHFAAETHVDRSIEHSSLFVNTNVLGTENLLKEFVRRDCHKKDGVFLYVSTDEVYGGWADRRWKEDTPLDPQNIYSATKAAGEHLVSAYGNVYGFNPRITRAGNNYGPNQDDSKLIPKMIKKALSNENFEIYGDGTNFRQWTHVEDHVVGLGKVLFARKTEGVWNIAGNDVLSNNEVVSHIIEATGSKSKIDYVPDRPGHDEGYQIDCSKIRYQLLWNPSIPFSQGIASLIEKYRLEHNKNTLV